MTKPSQSGFKRFFYNQNIKRDKSGKKYKNLIDHAIILVKRVEKEGMNAWLDNAVSRAKNKISAYGIALHQFESALQHKKLSHLTELFHQTFGGERVFKKTAAAKKVVQKEVVVKEVKEKKTTKKGSDTKEVKVSKPAAKKTTVKKEAKAETKKPAEKKVTEKKTPAKKTTTTKTTKTKASA